MNAPIVYQAYSLAELEKLAWAVANSQMFGIKTVEQAMVLMAIAQAEGRPAALAARDYDIIGGRPAKKAEALLRDFLQAGGHVEWHALTDDLADATFSHEAGGTVRITWDLERAKRAGLEKKDNWVKYRRQMLRARCVAEGARTVCPIATGGLPTSEELRDELPEKDITPEATTPALEPPVTLELVLAAYDAAQDVPAFQKAREMAAKLSNGDKIKAREKDMQSRERLKGPAGKIAQASAGAPEVSYAKLLDAMRARKDVDLLDADATLIDQLPKDQRDEATAEYQRLRARLTERAKAKA